MRVSIELTLKRRAAERFRSLRASSSFPVPVVTDDDTAASLPPKRFNRASLVCYKSDV